MSFSLRSALSAEELDAIDRLHARLGDHFGLTISIYHPGEFVGWSFGLQDGPDRYYMINTANFPAHQGKGIYTYLLPCILERVRQEGFQVVYSWHVMTNSQVLVPKKLYAKVSYEPDDAASDESWRWKSRFHSSR